MHELQTELSMYHVDSTYDDVFTVNVACLKMQQLNLTTESETPPISPDGIKETKERRALRERSINITYTEPSLKRKLRKGDHFTFT